MTTLTHTPEKSIHTALSTALAICAIAVGLVCATSTFAQAKSAPPETITSLSQTFATIAGVPTLLTVTGTGNCKYRLSYAKQDAPSVAQAQMTYSSTPQNPFPMNLKLFDATPAGTYTWTVTGIDGCTGSKSLTFTVR